MPVSWPLLLLLVAPAWLLAELCEEALTAGLPDSGFSASSSLSPSHSPWFAHLNRRKGAGGWSPKPGDHSSWLQIDLGQRTVVEAVATQGRYGSHDWLSRYHLLASDTGSNWRPYRHDNIAWVFIGNGNAEAVVRQQLPQPIRLRFLRLIPLAWAPHGRVGLRLELYGCPYETHAAYLDGQSYLAYRFESKARATHKDALLLRFVALTGSGVLVHGEGRRGDNLRLELIRGRLHLLIGLGGMVPKEVWLGALLDDGHWHSIGLDRHGRHGNLSVDGHVIAFTLPGHRSTLQLDYQLTFGGVPSGGKAGSAALPGFHGCLEEVHYNSEDILDLGRRKKPQLHIWGNVTWGCLPKSPTAPVTFPPPGGYVHLPWPVSRSILRWSLSLEFRTWDSSGLLWQTDSPSGHGPLRLALLSGRLRLSGGHVAGVMDAGQRLNNGAWHSVRVSGGNYLTLEVDGQVFASTKWPGAIPTGHTYFGGFPEWVGIPFFGCLRAIRFDDQPLDLHLVEQGLLGNFSNVLLDTCGLVDRCLAQPCEHGGLCSQSWEAFTCSCQHTGYGGSTCHTSIFEASCEAYGHLGRPSGRYSIDLDGSGPLPPLKITCSFAGGKAWTTLEPFPGTTTTIAPSSSSLSNTIQAPLAYGATLAQLAALVVSAQHCQQEVSYSCTGASSDETPIRWLGRTNKKQSWWGRIAHGVRVCACGAAPNCTTSPFPCTCDVNLDTRNMAPTRAPSKPGLPVTQLLIGIKKEATEKEPTYHVGPLRCYGDGHLWNAAWFTGEAAHLLLPPVWGADSRRAGPSLDIQLAFRTTGHSGLLLETLGARDSLRLRLASPLDVVLSLVAGGRQLEVHVRTPRPINDGTWHWVQAERGPLEAWLQVDELPQTSRRAPPHARAPLRLTSPLYVGASASGSDSFRGCLRALRLNGKPLDLEGYARASPDVRPRCPSPCPHCHNGGRCRDEEGANERGGCDCRASSFDGPMCSTEVGALFESGVWLEYNVTAGYDGDAPDVAMTTINHVMRLRDSGESPLTNGAGRSGRGSSGDGPQSHPSPLDEVLLATRTGTRSVTEVEEVRLVFRTQHSPALLLLVGGSNHSLLALTLQSNGSLQVTYKLGGGPNVESVSPFPQALSDGMSHSLHLNRQGTRLVIQLDNHSPQEHRLHAPLPFLQPTVLYLGQLAEDHPDLWDFWMSESVVPGFTGCLSSVVFNGATPLKAAFRLSSNQPPGLLLSGTLQPAVCSKLPQRTNLYPNLTTHPSTSASTVSLFNEGSDAVTAGSHDQRLISSSDGGLVIMGAVTAVSIPAALCLLALLARHYIRHKRKLKGSQVTRVGTTARAHPAGMDGGSTEYFI
uniref:contactin-associated protein-like 5 n=1 Tax=Myxine glutinosa TaxID=7769 RepID=UPI00358E5EC4